MGTTLKNNLPLDIFNSAVFKLTVYCLSAIMAVSLTFSGIIYAIGTREMDSRLQGFSNQLQELGYTTAYKNYLTEIKESELKSANANFTISILYINILILIIGGIASFLFAKRILKPIEEAHKNQARFTSDASHELRTPLAIMKTEIEYILSDKQATKEDFRETLESSLEEVNNLTELSATLLALAKNEHTKLPMTSVNLTRLVSEVSAKYNSNERIQLQKSNQNVYLSQANAVSIRQLVTILIDNALKYSPDNSKIKINLCSRKNQAILTVQNSGEGINKEDLPHIFERFYQSDKSRNKNKGSGLGLALALNIARRHGGEINATSRPKKTVFTVVLPIKYS